MTLHLAHTTSTSAHRPRPVGGRGPIRVVLADDHPVVRLELRRLIDEQPDLRVVADARIAEEAVGYFEEGDDVAVVDYHLGGEGGGLWVTRRLKRLPIPPRVLVYSASSEPAAAVAARVAGADGLLTTDSLRAQLCATIRRLAAGEQYLPSVPMPLADVMSSRVLPEDRATFGMLLAGVPPEVVEQRHALTRDELEDRRGMILRTLTVAAQTGFPLDHEQGSYLQNVPVLQV